MRISDWSSDVCSSDLHGTNAYRHVRHVVVIGLWNYAEAAYAAHHMATLPRQEGLSVTKEQLDAIKAGEHQHHLLQAICRANVRNCVGGACGECQVYVIGKMKPELDRKSTRLNSSH